MKAHEECTHYNFLSDYRAYQMPAEIGPCPRYDICMKKTKYPIDEYKEIACETERHIECLFYITWHFRRPSYGQMDTLEVDDEYLERINQSIARVKEIMKKGG